MATEGARSNPSPYLSSFQSNFTSYLTSYKGFKGCCVSPGTDPLESQVAAGPLPPSALPVILGRRDRVYLARRCDREDFATLRVADDVCATRACEKTP